MRGRASPCSMLRALGNRLHAAMRIPLPLLCVRVHSRGPMLPQGEGRRPRHVVAACGLHVGALRHARTSLRQGRRQRTRARAGLSEGGGAQGLPQPPVGDWREAALRVPHPKHEERNRVTKNAASVRSEDNQTGVVSLGCVTLHMKVLLCKTVVVSCGRPARSLVPLPPRTLEMRVRERVS